MQSSTTKPALTRAAQQVQLHIHVILLNNKERTRESFLLRRGGRVRVLCITRHGGRHKNPSISRSYTKSQSEKTTVGAATYDATFSLSPFHGEEVVWGAPVRWNEPAARLNEGRGRKKRREDGERKKIPLGKRCFSPLRFFVSFFIIKKHSSDATHSHTLIHPSLLSQIFSVSEIADVKKALATLLSKFLKSKMDAARPSANKPTKASFSFASQQRSRDLTIRIMGYEISAKKKKEHIPHLFNSNSASMFGQRLSHTDTPPFPSPSLHLSAVAGSVLFQILFVPKKPLHKTLVGVCCRASLAN